ncbi:unnamed protein product [Tilletia controversa]|uniref:Cutinase n=3 Tax=Tilletia TaxID=13289 RepID=A0A8X7MNA9_9BASI|nr:hypothetical protein CF336_g6538 [Tilletia laevis]KAE8189848.1 hypothetical protein CF328_g6155 [Tilletia controversa]KAE8256753.1 hypothetical protein A4X03_0g5090 [Tilletia caries]KAE8192225.1 hypothetical protein CF335_g5891 [Tilletia laevis]KAE8242263.1 hypothetical protein A4X06_0g7071 [Tilletia controversa]
MFLATSTLLLALTLPFLIAAEAVSKPGASIPAPSCHKYVIVDSRGTGEGQGQHSQFSGMIQKTLSSLPGGISVSNPYPASSAPNSPSDGAAWLRNYLKQGVAACPRQKYALLGWSQGASVTWIGIEDLKKGDPVYHAIKAIVVVGDPFHLPNTLGNVDEMGHALTAGAEGFMSGGFADSTITRWAATGKVLDICYSGDAVCNRQAGGFANHGKYGGTAEVQTLGGQFLMQKLGFRMEHRKRRM